METRKNRNGKSIRPGIAILLAIITICCSKKSAVQPVTNQTIYKDTVLNIDSLNFTDHNGASVLTQEIAQKTLEEYYTDKDIHNYKTGYQDDEGNKMCAYYDTLYTYHLNNDRHEDGIIAYHLMPCLASGHCYQASYAFITNINKKYKIVNPEFLPPGYGIDSITNADNFNYLYFYRFDCGENKIVKRYRAKLSRK